MRTVRPFSLLVVVLLLAVAPRAQVEGVGYRLFPGAVYVAFDPDAALTDGLLYGGGAGISFGEFLELNGAYLFGNGFETDYAGLSGAEEDPGLQAALAALPAREVGVERYGGDLKLNLSTGALVPFVRGGAGVVRFSPDGSDAARSLYLLGGAGLQLVAADRYTLTLGGEVFAYRYNPGATFFSADELDAVGLGVEDFNQTQVVNPAARAALQLYLGGRRPGALTDLDREFQRQFSGGLGGLSLVAEPFYARVDFDEALDYADQAFVGGEVGVDVGPLVGLRGFYGRGTADGDPTSFRSVQLWGGDLRLRLSDGDGIVPFLAVGAGLVDVLDGYADEGEAGEGVDRALAEDRPFALAGAGLEVPVGQRVRLVAEARALALSAQDGGDVSRPDEVFLNPTYRAGLAIGLGGQEGRRVAAVRQRELDTVEGERARLDAERVRLQAELDARRAAAAAREAELQRAIDEARLAGDSAAVARLELQRIDARLDAAVDTAAVAIVTDSLGQEVAAPLRPTDAASPARAGSGGVATPARTVRGERVVTIPLPETGELYVRYGDPDDVPTEAVYGTDAVATPPAAAQATEADLRIAVREALREALGDQALSGDALTEADLAAIERSVENRVADRIGDRLRDRDGGITAADLAALESRLEQRLALAVREARAQQAATPVVVTPDGEVVRPEAAGPPPAAPTPEQLVVVPETEPELVVVRRRGVQSVSPLGGVGFGRSGAVLVGLRARYGAGSLTYLPELAVAVAGRRQVAASVDAAFDLPSGRFADVGAPYARVGVGVVYTGASDELPPTFDEEPDEGGTAATLNLGLGAELAVGGGRLFVDLTTGNVGRYNRLTAGYRIPFGLRTD